MDREKIKSYFAWGIIVVSALVMITTLRGKYMNRAMVPQLVPFFGTFFAILFVLIQAGACLVLDMKIGLAWIAGMFLLAFIAGHFGEAMHSFEKSDYEWTRHRMVAGTCLSGLVLGVQILRRKI